MWCHVSGRNVPTLLQNVNKLPPTKWHHPRTQHQILYRRKISFQSRYHWANQTLIYGSWRGGINADFWPSSTQMDVHSVLHTSYRPPEHAKERGVSLVLSDWASMSAPCVRRISTTFSWPAVAARISGVKPFLSRCSEIKRQATYE